MTRRFLTEQADRERLPVALLSGFLGSGKTTLLNALLKDPRLSRTAVAVNEFGEIPLDQHLIDHGSDRTVVMANGCLCCNLAGDLEDAVMRVFSRRQTGEIPGFDRLIIEPSGLADPAPIAQAILRNPVMSRVLRLDAILATADALFVEAQLDRHPETRKQAALADCIVLTKPDLVDANALPRIEAAIRCTNPAAPIHPARHGEIDPALLFPPEFLSPGAIAAGPRTPIPQRSALLAELVDTPSNHAGSTVATCLTADAPLDWARFDTWLRSVRLTYGEQLLRVKGMLDVAGAAGPVVIQGVHHVLHTPVELDAWPSPDRRSRIVLITQGAPDGLIRQSWDGALPDLRNLEAPRCAP